MSAHRNIYALLVGINEYPSPISRLNGCVRDVRRVQEYLQNQVGSVAKEDIKVRHTASGLSVIQQGSLQLCALEDEAATYPNIIAGFREHLQQAQAEDMVWFHFSGHGTESYTASEFRESLEPNGKDQNLVCYSRQPEKEQFLLADKELAILLHEVANAPDKKRAPHIVVSLDCCHSGSGTRDSEWEENEVKPRMTTIRIHDSWAEAAAAGGLRGLDSYLSGYFTEKPLDLPLSEHILFSACTSIQTAGDTLGGGIFTNSLLETLVTADGPINYADLFLRTRASVKRERKQQHPQFETIGGFDPYRQFLDGQACGTPDHFEMVKERKHWLVKCGAIHGIPVRPAQPIKVEIIADGNVLGNGHLTSVGAQKSRVEITSDTALDEDTFYQAKVTYLPLPPLQVALEGDEAAISTIIEAWRPELGISWVRGAATAAGADLMVQASSAAHRIIDQRAEKEVFAIHQREDLQHLIVSSLGKIVRWERTLVLENRRSRIRSRFELEMEVLLHGNQRKQYTDEQLLLTADNTPLINHQDMLVAGFQPQVRITNREQALYFYLYHLRSDYSIQSYEGEVVFRPAEHPGEGDLLLPLLKTHKGWGLGVEDQAVCSYFKLFVTTEPLDYQQLIQSGLGGDRAANWNWNPVGVSDDWCAVTTKVEMQK